MQLLIHPAAERELDEALKRSLRDFGPQVAAQLRGRIEEAGLLLLREPAIGTRAPGGARLLPLGRYPFSLVYRVEGQTVHVLALMHQSREPGYWHRRR